MASNEPLLHEFEVKAYVVVLMVLFLLLSVRVVEGQTFFSGRESIPFLFLVHSTYSDHIDNLTKC